MIQAVASKGLVHVNVARETSVSTNKQAVSVLDLLGEQLHEFLRAPPLTTNCAPVTRASLNGCEGKMRCLAQLGQRLVRSHGVVVRGTPFLWRILWLAMLKISDRSGRY